MWKKIIQKLKMDTGLESMNWSYISSRKDFKGLLERSENQPQVIYKHSSRCSISYLSKQDLEENMDTLTNIVDMHLLDVIEERDLSQYIAETLDVRHESPQVILIERGRVLWSGSHWEVKGDNIRSELN
jgi:bacillithiol system protein YtxJ